MSSPIRFGLVTMDQRWLEPELAHLDGLGYDALYVVDHPSFAAPDPWTWLAFAAGQTSRVRLGTHVTGAPFRDPVSLARQVAAVDVLSRGRACLGIGTAYEHQDFGPYGYEMPTMRVRIEMLDETLQILDALFSREETEFRGAHFRLEGGATFAPKPVQQPRVPIVVGLNRPGALLRMAAARADGINTWQLGPAQVAELRGAIVAEVQRAGRKPDALELSSDVLLARGADRGAADGLARAVRDAARSWGRTESATDWDASGVLYGSAAEIVDQVRAFELAGVSELTVAIANVDDLRWFDEEVISRFRRA